MLALTLPLGISILSNATLYIPRPASSSDVPATSLGHRVTPQDVSDLPARLPRASENGLIPSHDLNVRYTGLWHGMLASANQPVPDIEGFHPGSSPAFPRQLLIHPAVRYLRRDVLYFPYLRHGEDEVLLCLPVRQRTHTPFLIGIDGLFVPLVYVSAENAVQATFPGDPVRSCGLRK